MPSIYPDVRDRKNVCLAALQVNVSCPTVKRDILVPAVLK